MIFKESLEHFLYLWKKILYVGKKKTEFRSQLIWISLERLSRWLIPSQRNPKRHWILCFLPKIELLLTNTFYGNIQFYPVKSENIPKLATWEKHVTFSWKLERYMHISYFASGKERKFDVLKEYTGKCFFFVPNEET